MTTTKPEMISIGTQYALLHQQYERECRGYINAVAPLTDEDFWLLIGKLQDDVKYRMNADHGCDEFVRSLCFDRSRRNIPKKFRPVDEDGQYVRGDELNGWELAAAFATKYDQILHKIHRALRDVNMHRGDDGFGDFCDSFPLAGQVAFDTLISSHRPTCDEIEGLVPEAWKKFICHGENYIVTTLVNNLIRRFCYIVSQSERQARSDKEDEEREERLRNAREAKKAKS